MSFLSPRSATTGSPPFVSLCTSVSMSPMLSTLRSSSFVSSTIVIFISYLTFSITISSPIHDHFKLSSQQPYVWLKIIVDFTTYARMYFHDLNFIQFCCFDYTNFLKPEHNPLPLLQNFRYST